MTQFSSPRHVIDVDEDQIVAISALATERDISTDEAINEALAAYLGKATKKEKDALAEAGIGAEDGK